VERERWGGPPTAVRRGSPADRPWEEGLISEGNGACAHEVEVATLDPWMCARGRCCRPESPPLPAVEVAPPSALPARTCGGSGGAPVPSSASRVFGWGATGAERSRPSFWGRLRPFSCLVEKIGLEWLRPSFLFGWRNELEEWMTVFTPLVGPICHRAYV
jgi:hypothetical protein